MGAGESVYVQKQEAFVRENRERYKNCKHLSGYSQLQIEGKLRQLYAGTDTSYDNRNSYINSTTWNKVRSSVVPTNKNNTYIYR